RELTPPGFFSYACGVFGWPAVAYATSRFCPHRSKPPERDVGDEEIAERLQARDILHFFRIGQPAIEHRHFRAQIEPRQRGILVDDIIGQDADAATFLDHLQHGEN